MPPPPVAVAVSAPSERPLQLTLLSTTTEQATGGFSLMSTSQIMLQALASVTVTVCIPASNVLAVAVVSPLSHA